MYSPLQTAPNPGTHPSPNASHGFAPNGAAGAAGCVTIADKHGSQYSVPRIARVHCAHSALPQFRQYPAASTSVWMAQFIQYSFPVEGGFLEMLDAAQESCGL